MRGRSRRALAQAPPVLRSPFGRPLGHAGVLLAVGQAGTLLRTGDFGASWSARGVGLLEDLHDVAWGNATSAYAVGDSGTLLVSADAGVSWRLVFAPALASAQFRGVHFLDGARGFAVGTATVRTLDAGLTWQEQQPCDSTGAFTDVAFLGAADLGWIVSDSGADLRDFVPRRLCRDG